MDKSIGNYGHILITPKERKNLLERLANDLLAEWGLTSKGWRFVWGKKRTAFGTCKVNKSRNIKTIELSLHLLPTIDQKEAEDTIRHEIAHALDYEQRGTTDHSWQWKAWAVKVGARPERCGKSVNLDVTKVMAYKTKYRVECKCCKRVRPSHRKLKIERSCGVCGQGVFNPKFLLEQIENHPDNIPQMYGGNAPNNP